MHSSLPLIALAGLAAALPIIPFITTEAVIPISKDPIAISTRQSAACFVIGSEPLPEETSALVDTLAGSVTCSGPGATTLSGVPDVTSGAVTFSQIDFSRSGQSPLEFALSAFATPDPLASSDLAFFRGALDVYLATEAGIRSVGGNLAIKVPKFFLEMQVSRVETAQGNPPSAPGLQVDHLRDKVLKNAAGEDQALLDQVAALAAQLQ